MQEADACLTLGFMSIIPHIHSSHRIPHTSRQHAGAKKRFVQCTPVPNDTCVFDIQTKHSLSTYHLMPSHAQVPLLSSLLATMFWLGTVVEYHTGVLPLNDGSMGVTEGQIVLIVIQLATARWGPALWRSELLGLVDPLTIMDTLLLATSVNILRVTIIMLGVLRSHYAARRTGTSRVRAVLLAKQVNNCVPERTQNLCP